ncbi:MULTISPECIES: A24 family peptidase [Kosmotoga]|jgi:leader peptidase (prepilin peptidase)/N-methyltransferase|uniref:Peptidase A24A domain protein n=1 Tax=Kosmotoga olearia (strain ATCC BAA-1733 / DSM 21960 / TBF 19.5.1) TaxID=521045 RepID=C5CFN9_KOSOT|nr:MULTISPECIES: A24 family peptidase [Kosmotoga]ACR80387.1 peptidase A24A domain protein [Kosmotoga olearia TBF 19.5.1]MDI3523357.1 leader peptidase (prepilin peptidase) / N-methyltransferase [Kosmotoga sp.]MDK2953364.1 leader peptidase (prepilin peptidase) / N-methyltransferase [Kosmotoga sp.]
MAVVSFIFGLVFGSFFNVVIYRLPRKEYTINRPARSFCPSCGHELVWKDNIPLLSYIVLRGRCRYCGTRIPIRYPVVEAITAVSFTINALIFPVPQALALDLVAAGLIISSFIDLEHYLIPDTGIILIGIGAVLFSYYQGRFPEILIHAALVTGAMVAFFLIANAVKKDSFGFGDVELIGALSLASGLLGSLYTVLFSSIAALLTYLVIIGVKGEKFEGTKQIPFGPFIAIGGYTAILLLDELRLLYGLVG